MGDFGLMCLGTCITINDILIDHVKATKEFLKLIK